MKKKESKVQDSTTRELRYTPDFHNYYFEVDDSTGTKKEKTFIGRKHEDLGTDFHAIAMKINKYIDQNFNQGKVK